MSETEKLWLKTALIKVGCDGSAFSHPGQKERGAVGQGNESWGRIQR